MSRKPLRLPRFFRSPAAIRRAARILRNGIIGAGILTTAVLAILQLQPSLLSWLTN